LNGKGALQAIKESKGAAITVQDSEIFSAEQEIARLEGIFAEPSSSATIAALKKLVHQGVIDKGDTVVCLITGSGLKATESNRCASSLGEKAENCCSWLGVEHKREDFANHKPKGHLWLQLVEEDWEDHDPGCHLSTPKQPL
jgi:threonine synthase